MNPAIVDKAFVCLLELFLQGWRDTTTPISVFTAPCIRFWLLCETPQHVPDLLRGEFLAEQLISSGVFHMLLTIGAKKKRRPSSSDTRDTLAPSRPSSWPKTSRNGTAGSSNGSSIPRIRIVRYQNTNNNDLPWIRTYHYFFYFQNKLKVHDSLTHSRRNTVCSSTSDALAATASGMTSIGSPGESIRRSLRDGHPSFGPGTSWI